MAYDVIRQTSAALTYTEQCTEGCHGNAQRHVTIKQLREHVT